MSAQTLARIDAQLQDAWVRMGIGDLKERMAWGQRIDALLALREVVSR